MEHFETALNEWLKVAQKICDDYMRENFPTLPRMILDIERGKRFVKVVRSDEGQSGRSVHCFIDIATGDVLKASSWKAPAKGARGSIYTLDSPGVNHYGGLYAR
jgi:hypothetical protein